MAAIFATTAVAVFFALTFVTWRRYLWAAEKVPQADTCPYSLTDVFVPSPPRDSVPASEEDHGGSRRSLQPLGREVSAFYDCPPIPYAGRSLTFAELDGRAESVAAALSAFLTGPDQVVAVAMTQDNWQIVAAHLGILKAGGTMMFLDTALPDALLTHMLNDAQPVVVLTRGQDKFRDLPTLDVLTLQEDVPKRIAALVAG